MHDPSGHHESHDDHAVVIAGGGPTGLTLAGELALAGVDVAIVERRDTSSLEGARAGGLHPRTLEAFDQRGLAERFLAQGRIHHQAPFAHVTLELGDLPSRHNYFLGIWQNQIEAILTEWVDELRVPIHRGVEVTGFAQDERGVRVELSDGRSLRARHLVGCDGGRSLVRKHAGIAFPGWDATTSYLIAEGSTTQEPAWGIRRTAAGIQALGKLDDGGRVRMVLSEPHLRAGDPTENDLREALIGVYGTDFGLRDVTWISRFTDATRQAAAYRDRRILLAGDAAHVHSPAGGQGLNLGVQDAFNLGWKLAQVVREQAPDALLDTYHAERHPAVARMLRHTMALTALERGDDRSDALREMIGETMQLTEPRQRYLAKLSGLDVHYDLGPGHPLLGRRMPDLDLVTADGPRRVFELLHRARPLLLDLGPSDALATTAAPWASRISYLHARYDGPWVLPVLGTVAAPSAVLVRPDGYLAWVGAGTNAGLREALSRWFGPPAA